MKTMALITNLLLSAAKGAIFPHLRSWAKAILRSAIALDA